MALFVILGVSKSQNRKYSNQYDKKFTSWASSSQLRKLVIYFTCFVKWRNIDFFYQKLVTIAAKLLVKVKLCKNRKHRFAPIGDKIGLSLQRREVEIIFCLMPTSFLTKK